MTRHLALILAAAVGIPALLGGVLAIAYPAGKVLDVCGAYVNPATGKCEGLPDEEADPADWWCTSSPAPLIGDPAWAADKVHEHPCTPAEFNRLCILVAAQVSPGDRLPSHPPCAPRAP